MKPIMIYSIGQILTSTSDVVVKNIKGEEVTIPKGNKIIIGADRLAHHIKTGYVQPLQDEDKVNGYSAEGLAEWIYLYMRNNLALDDMLSDYDESKESFKNIVAEALNKIGFYHFKG